MGAVELSRRSEQSERDVARWASSSGSCRERGKGEALRMHWEQWQLCKTEEALQVRHW
jgi:hypothetical protein